MMADSPRGSARVRLVGLGSPHGLDRLGWDVVRAVPEEARGWLDLAFFSSPIDLLTAIDPHWPLAVVDATATPLPDSPLWRFRWPDLPLEPWDGLSSHGFDLDHTLKLAASLHLLPELVLVYAVDPSPWCAGGYDSTQRIPCRDLARAITTDLHRAVFGQPGELKSGPLEVTT